MAIEELQANCCNITGSCHLAQGISQIIRESEICSPELHSSTHNVVVSGGGGAHTCSGTTSQTTDGERLEVRKLSNLVVRRRTISDMNEGIELRTSHHYPRSINN